MILSKFSKIKAIFMNVLFNVLSKTLLFDNEFTHYTTHTHTRCMDDSPKIQSVDIVHVFLVYVRFLSDVESMKAHHTGAVVMTMSSFVS